MAKNNEGQVVVKNERKYYLDNIRVLIILGLFVAHSCEMYHLQDGFYIEGAKSLIPTIIYNSLRSWYMATLFLIAGLTTMYSLKKRTIKGYYIERCKRLLIPFLAGILLLVPVQSYFVMKNHYGFNGNIFEAYVHFFTTYSDGFYGYDGGFTPSHLWFLIYLFLISLATFPIIRYKSNTTHQIKVKATSLIWFTLLIYIISYGQSDESPVKYIAFFALGLLLYDNVEFYKLIAKYSWSLLLIGISTNICMGFMLMKMDEINVWTVDYAWMRLIWAVSCTTMVFGVIGTGQKYINYINRFFEKLSNCSFAIYFIHMTVLLPVGYFVIKYLKCNVFIQILITMNISIIVTVLLVEICKKIPGVRFALGLK
mgnify:FL=1